ncbi:MAG TPA: bifunctional proline dehydrogenase/L-glutamate gamma-semialdehyde dehydrogenase, partial [Protaetiibacter sp.]|nr:bifunctional proline dehydrogenase/L-glutamate gamma-semialdehyde dehydrogenase [Protaetiibacter sp.]
MAVPPDLPTLDETVALVRRWLAAADDLPSDPGAKLLAGVLKDPVGLDFTLGFVDRVVRPEDPRVAAKNFERLSRRVPRFLPWPLRALITLGGGFSVLFPWLVIPIARRVLRRMVDHLVVDATPRHLDKTLGRLRASGARLNLNLLGEAVLGDREAARRLQGTRELLARDDVDYVSVKVSSIAAQLSLWGFDETVERTASLLRPLYLDAARTKRAKFINLDMEEYRDLGLTIAVFTRLLEEPELKNLEAGIVLQAYLPDSVAALAHLTEWAQRRVAAGGAGIKVRIVKGANLALERVEATLHGWPLATWSSKQATDTNYKRMLLAALTPEATDAVRIGVAGHNLFDLAWAWLLAQRRGVEHQVDVEMLLGMAGAQARAVRSDIRRLILYTPVVQPDEFDTAVGYLVRRLEENAGGENFMSGIFELDDEKVFGREADRFARALAELDDDVPPANRTQNRLSPPLPRAPERFRNEPDTDPALVANRLWGVGILERSTESTLGVDTIATARIDDPARLDALLASAAEAGRHWGQVPGHSRAELLERAAEVLAVFRGRFIEVMASETGKTIAEADVEVSEAVDFALYYAERARELSAIRDAAFVPAGLVVVTPPWNFPVSIPAGGVLASLAAGSAVVLKPAPQARRCGAVLAEALWEAGVPRELLHLVEVAEDELGRRLITAPQVRRVVLTGAYGTAALFRSWRPELPLLAETSGKNAIVVTPAADYDLAVRDIVASAFGNAGQKCSAASLAILVGSAGES